MYQDEMSLRRSFWPLYYYGDTDAGLGLDDQALGPPAPIDGRPGPEVRQDREDVGVPEKRLERLQFPSLAGYIEARVVMRCAAVAAIGLCACLAAQVSVDPRRFPQAAAAFERESGEKRFGCTIRKLNPALTFAFQFQAGWRLEAPFANVRPDPHPLALIARVTPEVEGRSPLYLFQQANLPERPENTKNTFQLDGAFLLGPGRYTVEVVAFDDVNVACRANWRMEANTRGLKSETALGEGEVRSFEPGLWTRFAEAGFDRPRAGSLTILLNVAPFRRRFVTTRLGGMEYGMILSSVAALIRFTEYADIRMVAYNLDQQKIVYEDEHFVPSSFRGLARAMRELDLGTVPVEVLQQRGGPSFLLGKLLRRERDRPTPSDTVLFFGPTVAYDGKWPAPAAPDPRLRYFDFRPFWGRRQPEFPDVIERITKAHGGRVSRIHSPQEFAKALRELKDGSQKGDTDE